MGNEDMPKLFVKDGEGYKALTNDEVAKILQAIKKEKYEENNDDSASELSALESAKAEVTKAKAEVAELQSKLNETTKKLSEKETCFGKSMDKIGSMKTERDELRANNESLTKELADLKVILDQPAPKSQELSDKGQSQRAELSTKEGDELVMHLLTKEQNSK
jgi:chromosome segregation ATPase